MKKFLSILLTFCLMLTVMAVAFPVFAEDTYTITFVKANGTSTTEQYAADDAIVYPDLTASIYGDNVWSASETAYAEAPKTATGDITVYEYLREGVYEFDNRYKVAYDKLNYHTGWGLRLNDADDNGKSVLKFTNTAETAYSSTNGTIQSNNYTWTSFDRYNSIDLGTVPAGESKSYRVTVAVKREASDLPLYLQPWTNSKSMNFHNSRKAYTNVKIPAVNTDETEYTEYTLEFTTPDNLVENATNGTNPKTLGNYLFLHVGSREAGESVAYIDYVIVEEVNYGDLTYHYADGTTEVVEDLVVGDVIDYAELDPNKMGENNGKWYTDAQGTSEAPATLPEGGLDVYEVVKTGVFDFENHYKPSGNLTTASGLRLNLDTDNGKGVMKYENTAESYTNNTTIYSDLYGGITTTNRYNAIDIGKVTAGVSKTYRVTVAVKRCASELPLTFEAWTSAVHLNYHNTRKTYGKTVTIPAVDADETEYKEYSFAFTTPATLGESIESNTVGETVRGNNLFLQVRTDDAGECVAYIDYVKVEELTGSVTYVIPENATVNGENGNVTVDYFGDDVPSFPEVQIAEGYESTGWTDTETGAAVETPVLGGNYTLGVKESVKKYTVTLNRGGVTETVQVEEGTEFTLPDTEFTDTSWWNNATANVKSRFVGYEGEKVVVNGNVTYYTTETYAKGSGANMYKNWTVVEDATEGLTYLHKTVTSDASSDWSYAGGNRVCTRLGIVEDGNTYKISVTYKATTDTPIYFLMTISDADNPGGSMRSYLEQSKEFHTVSEDTNGWTTATFYITADTPHEVTANNNGLDDTKVNLDFDALYLLVNKETGSHNVDIAIKETKIEDLGNVVEAKGASVLKEEKVVNGEQALRYYFDYKTAGDGTTITIGGNEYDVVERGFLYTNGAIDHYAAEGVKGSAAPADKPDLYNYTGRYFVSANANKAYGYAASFQMWLARAKNNSSANLLTYKGVSGEALANNWALDNGTVTFSTYVTDIPTESYSAKMMVRGYVIFEDENDVQHIVYSQTVNRSVQGIKDALDAGNAGNNGDHDE